jgi:DNA-binding CsgD family transcriptional regulator
MDRRSAEDWWNVPCPAIARLKITLDDVEPVGVREVPLAIRLDRLHLVMQAAIPSTTLRHQQQTFSSPGALTDAAHQCTIARRNGDWEFLETPELTQAKREIKKLHGALDILSKPFPDHELLTPRERLTLAQIVRGASSKEAARALGIGPRTVEFHRENIMRKFAAKNTVDLVRRVLGE